jgi:hypothetical protein
VEKKGVRGEERGGRCQRENMEDNKKTVREIIIIIIM